MGGKLKHKACKNTREGFEALDLWLKKQKVDRVHACLEATGTYGDALALHLHDAGHVVSIVNPARIKGFAQSLNGIQAAALELPSAPPIK